MALTLLPLIDDQKCFQTVRELRWTASGARIAIRRKSRNVVLTTLKRHASVIAVAAVILSLTTSRERSSRGITSRCESGFCASTSWG